MTYRSRFHAQLGPVDYRLVVTPRYPQVPRANREARKLIADALRCWRNQVRENLRAELVRVRPHVRPRGE